MEILMFINSNSSFDNTYVKFPDRFYERLNPTKVPNPSLIKLNIKLAKDLGLDPDFLSSQIGADIFSGNYIFNYNHKHLSGKTWQYKFP